jgi:8-oxo-dGTP pyrophosphatase MutT (NUDIX family)
VEKEKAAVQSSINIWAIACLFAGRDESRPPPSLVKGHVKDGESEIMTAYREIKEETNLEVVIDNDFRQIISYPPYKSNTDIIKDVIFFAATPVKGA